MLGYSIVLDVVGQTWPPFVLVAGLLLVGQVADADGLFESLAARIARARLSPRALLVSLLAVDAIVTAILNLDTAVVFLTPVFVHAARRRGLDDRPFLYGAVFMSNSASLLLPGSNLTNLLVLEQEHVSGLEFGARMLPAWLASCAITAIFVVLVFRLGDSERCDDEVPPLRVGIGAAAVGIAAALTLALPDPALPVLVTGVCAVGIRRLRPRVDTRALALLFALATGLGALARAWPGPAALLAGLGRWQTAGVGALGSILANNLPAAVLLSTHVPAHPRALLLGLDLGPNLAVTGSLSAFLWLQSARAAGADPSIRTYSRLGLALVPLTLVGALGALALLAPRGF